MFQDIDAYQQATNPIELIFKDDMLKHIMIYDRTVEIIGISAELETNQEVFKFTMNNRIGKKIQVIAYKDTRKNAEPMVKHNSIIHLDGVTVRAKDKYSRGNVPFDLIIRTNSKINLLKKLQDVPLAPVVNNFTSHENLDDAAQDTNYIEIKCYLMQKIGEIILNNNEKVQQGCITDMNKKLAIRIREVLTNEIKVGDYIKVKGRILEGNRGFFYLMVYNPSDINIIEPGKKRLYDMTTIIVNAKRKKEDSQDGASTSKSDQKKLKLDE